MTKKAMILIDYNQSNQLNDSLARKLSEHGKSRNKLAYKTIDMFSNSSAGNSECSDVNFSGAVAGN